MTNSPNNNKVTFSDIDLDIGYTATVESPEEEAKKKTGRKKPKDKRIEKKTASKKGEKSQTALEKRAKEKKRNAWLIISFSILGIIILCFAAVRAAFYERPLSEIRSYVNQANAMTAFDTAGVLSYLQVAFPEYMATNSKANSDQLDLVASSYDITRVTKITDDLAMVNFVVYLANGNERTQTAWSVMLNDEGAEGYSIANDFRNVAVPVFDAPEAETPFMEFTDLKKVDDETLSSANAFIGNFLDNYYRNNAEVVNSMYSNSETPLVFTNTGQFIEITALEIYDGVNQLGYNGKVDFTIMLNGSTIKTTKYFLIETSPALQLKRLL